MKQFDVIVVGARVAGTALAYELAKSGYEVLLLDKARFPSDILSTHNFMGNSLAMLREMGVLQKLLEQGTPTYNRAVIRFEDAVLDGRFPEVDGETECLCIRRTYLDEVMFRHAASQPGVTAIEGFRMTDVCWEGDTVTGIEGIYRSGQKERFGAKLVVGADGRQSALRKLVNSRCLQCIPTDYASYVGYYEGYKQDGDIHVELYKMGDKMGIVFPTSDNLYVVGVMFPLNDNGWMEKFRISPQSSMLEIVESGFVGAPFPERLRKALPVGPVKGLLGYNNDWFQGMGKGWALVGDALSFKDPAVGQGMPDALYGVRSLTAVLTRHSSWSQSWEEMSVEYQDMTERRMMPRFQMACQFTKNMPFTPEQQKLNHFIAGNPAATSAFLGIYNHAVEPEKFGQLVAELLQKQGAGAAGKVNSG